MALALLTIVKSLQRNPDFFSPCTRVKLHFKYYYAVVYVPYLCKEFQIYLRKQHRQKQFNEDGAFGGVFSAIG